MGRPRHPNKHVERSVQYAESLGWRVLMSKKGMPGVISIALVTTARAAKSLSGPLQGTLTTTLVRSIVN